MTHPNGNIPRGLCQCGCGRETTIAKKPDPIRGTKTGEPNWYLTGHHRRKSPVDYTVEDRGFETPCWIWQGSRDGTGYGQKFLPGGKVVPAHRHMYEAVYRAIPEGLVLHHRCEQKACVNPDHLMPVTQAENLRFGPNVKLTAADAAEIKRLAQATDMTQVQIGALFGITGAHVCSILQDKYWR